MRFSSYINNQRCLEWGLNANQGALFDLLNQSAAWAKSIVVNGEVFYWVSRNEVIKELPLFYSKSDTVYRHFVELAKKGLIEYLKIDGKDLIRLTEKGKMWNEFNSDFNPTLGNKSEQTRIEIRKSSDLNPTNNNTNYKNTSDHTPPISPQGEPPRRKSLKSRSVVEIEHPELVELPEYVNRDSWIAYCKMRKAKGNQHAIKTEDTLKLCLKNLEKYSGGNPDLATAILEQSIGNTWTGIFALKTEFTKRSGAVNAHDKSGKWAIGRTITVKSGAMR